MTDWYKELQTASEIAKAVIKKVGNQHCIFSKSGKKLQCFATRKQALKRLREIEFFSRRDKKNG